jgi:hypothetical protein
MGQTAKPQRNVVAAASLRRSALADVKE